MRQKDWFVLGVRWFGVWAIVQGIEELVALAEARFGLTTSVRVQLDAYVLHAAVYFAVGAYLLSGASILTNFAFGSEDLTDPNCSENADGGSPQ